MALTHPDTPTTGTLNEHRDPITGAPGAHPVGTGIGAAIGGAALGAATGTAAGPVGTLIGAAIGAIAGGLAGKEIAEAVDPSAEEAYWRDNYQTREYVEPEATFVDYGPAYGYGVDAFTTYDGRSYDDVEPQLARDWDTVRGTSNLEWDRARHATRDAWTRLSDGSAHIVPPAARDEK